MSKVQGRRLSAHGHIMASDCVLKVVGLFFLLTTLLFLGGCAGRKPATETDYFKVLDRWTKSKKIFKNFESILYIYATYKDPTFRRAYIDEYARRYRLDEDYKDLLVERDMEVFESYNEFFIAAYTPVDRWNDFDEDSSIWRLYLEDELGSRLVPIEITRVERSEPLVMEFFPYLDPWSIGYIVRFPRYTEEGREVPGPDTRSLKLIIGGALGGGELEWSFQK